MPIYEYRCTDCGQTFERYQGFGDDPIAVCPLPADDTPLNGTEANGTVSECGGEVRKVFSNVGISFKGSGFYRNDSRSDSRSKSKTTSDGSSDSSSTSKDSGTKDSTPSGSKESSSVGAASASG